MLIFLQILLMITAFLCGLYFLSFTMFATGWSKSSSVTTIGGASTRVAVIIAVRNESAFLGKCLDGLLKQDYSSHLLEIIVVDDNSEDDTYAIAESLSRDNSMLRVLRSSGIGKRCALDQAVALTDAELILATDGDCTHPTTWVSAMAAFYKETGADMIAGPVIFPVEKSLWTSMQMLEMLAIMGTTGGSLFWDLPVMCNGANLGFARKAYVNAGGYCIGEGVSGDDVHLMYRISGSRKGSVKFLRDRKAIVQTPAARDLRTFITQRKRWSSKPLSSLSTSALLVAAVVWLTSLFLVASLIFSGIAALSDPGYLAFFRFCLILITIKCIIDFLLLFLAATFFDRKYCLYYFLPEQILYLIYVIIIGMPWKKKTYEWKGRKINY